jgi:hypothetical protein
MDWKKIFNPSDSAFYTNKLGPAMNSGLSRIELSSYFSSQADQVALFKSMTQFEKRIDATLAALNATPQLRYRLSFSQCLNSYFDVIDTKQVLIAFEKDLWAIAYSYSSRSCRFTGHLTDIHVRSGSMLDFLKRFGRAHCRIFIRGKEFVVRKDSAVMQLPIASLNQQHQEEYTGFGLDFSRFSYTLSDQQLDSISFNSESNDFYRVFGIERRVESAFADQMDLGQSESF